jgi:hypothetical protein
MAMRRTILGCFAALALCLPTLIAWPGGAAGQPQAAAPIPSGMARVWFLRRNEPYVSLATPMLFINGAPLAPSVPGTAFYRDVAPGTYTFSVASYGIAYNQAQTVPLAAGDEVYFYIWCDPRWASGKDFQRDTFFVLPIPPPLAWQCLHLPDMADLGAR